MEEVLTLWQAISNDENAHGVHHILLKPIARLVVRHAGTCRTIDARQVPACRRLSQPIAANRRTDRRWSRVSLQLSHDGRA